MTLHASDNVITHNAKQTAKKRSRKYTVVAAGLGVVLAGSGAALAAMLLSGDGSASAQAYEGKALVIAGEKFSKQLYPGAQADMTFTVKNDNPFPVILSQVTPGKLDYAAGVGKCGSTTNGGEYLSGPAVVKPETKAVTGIAVDNTIPANGSANVTIPNAIKLDAASTGGCTATVSFKVTGSGSGN